MLTLGAMQHIRWVRGAASVMALLAFACSGGATSSSSSGSSGASGPPGSTAARCVGKPVEAYDVNDRESCVKQGSTWRDTARECEGTYFSVNCARVDSSTSPEETVRAACLDMPGCGYTEADGSITKPSGKCTGTKIPCKSLSDEDSCRSQSGCIFYSSTGCEPLNGYNYLDNVDCGGLNISQTVSFSVVRSACKRAKGCTWTD